MPQGGLAWIAIAAGAAAGLFLAWQAAETLLLIFAGILFGVLLDALARPLMHYLGLGRALALGVVCILIAVALGTAVIASGYTLVQQWDELGRVLNQQVAALRDYIENLGLSEPQTADDKEAPLRSFAEQLLPDPGRLFGSARSAFTAALGIFGSGLVILLIGIFAAASPTIYRNGVLVFVPRARRPRVGEVLDEMGEVLRWWLVGQLVTMGVIGVSVWVALAFIGMPGALLLGLQAALLNFIPYLGPFLAAVPIVLAALPQGASVFGWALGLYLVIQTLEGYVLMPLIQKRAVNLPPVLSLASLMIFGTLFGAVGVAMATPLVAAMRVAAIRLYVEDVLQANSEGSRNRARRVDARASA